MKKLTVISPLLSEEHIEMIKAAANKHGYAAAFPRNDAELAAELSDTEIAFGFPSKALKNAPALRWFCSFAAGVEGCLEPAYFASPEVTISNASGAYGVMIAEHIVMFALELCRRRAEHLEIVRRREWVRDLKVRSVFGSRVTILGTGDLGSEAAKRLRAFEPERITGVNRSGKNPGGAFDEVVTSERLDTVLPETDILIMCLPATDKTVGIMNAGRLALLPETAFVINVGRGSALDQSALEAMLRSGKLAGAALDVFETEPIPRESSLWSCPNLLITPHIAGTLALYHSEVRVVELFLEDFENYCAGRPLERRVLRDIGY